ncbi:MAG: T9SS type A sorting domain-containing protein, partial [Ignavibacteriaceae bacterium]
VDWQNSHTENIDWYNCSTAHSQSLNGNLKAYAAWYLWASLAGWDGITGVKNDEIISRTFNLYQNYPNPFNPTTKIQFTIPDVGTSFMKFVQLKVYDILGNEIATLVNEEKPAGMYEVTFDASYLSSGIYFYKLNAGDFVICAADYHQNLYSRLALEDKLSYT